ncbi:MAG: DUF1624 domain-containing protein [Verrucomicrobia bacterium]|nr:DUF1624 domain-containing protein [Verrucomicrobiota bacterium]
MASDPDAVSATVETIIAPNSATVRPRLDSVDLLRGLVMILMALDHTRAFFSNVTFYPLDLGQTWPALYFTRWITHFCAPVFVFLAGTGAFLSTTRGKTKKDLSWFLLTRGLWLVLLECTVILWFGWSFSINFRGIGAAVIWAIGWSMVALAGLVFLPIRWIAGFGLLMIAGHNLLDRVSPEQFGSLDWLWRILHVQSQIRFGSDPAQPTFTIGVGYPLIPWIGVMAAGYAFGSVVLREPQRRQRSFLTLGAGLFALFVVFRALNQYGDSSRWSVQKDTFFTFFSFINCTKYPPSLLYLLMTLGPALILLAFLDRGTPRVLEPVLVFGRVPLFYYLLHLPLIHGLAVALRPAGVGYDLPMIYAVWIGVILILYPACRWFAEFKRRRRDAWLSYL